MSRVMKSVIDRSPSWPGFTIHPPQHRYPNNVSER